MENATTSHLNMDSASTVAPMTTRGLATAVVFGVLSVFGAVGNILTILAVVFDRQLRSHSTSLLIVNLSVADLMVFAIIEPFLSFASATGTWPFSIPLCAGLGLLVVQHIAVASCGMAAIAVNRYYSVVKANKHQTPKLLTRRWTLLLCFATWLPGLILIILQVATPFDAQYSPFFELCVIVPLHKAVGRAVLLLQGLMILLNAGISLLCYFQIYRSVKQSRRRIEPTERAGGRANLDIKTISGQPSEESRTAPVRQKIAKAQRTRTEVAISINLFVVFAVFFVCWAPLTVVIFVHSLVTAGVHFQQLDAFLPAWAWQMTYKMVLFNSTFNVIIYAWRNRNIRSAFHKLCRRCNPLRCVNT